MSFIYLIVPVIAFFIAQLTKFFLPHNRLKPTLRNLFAYSGMPSAHAAVTVSLATIIGLKEGLDSPIFALAILTAFMVLRDALGIRQYIGRQGKVINELVEDLNEDQYLDDDYPQLIEKVGHSLNQIAVGSTIGFLVGVILYYLS